MTLSLSPQLRLIVVIGLLSIVGLSGGVVVLAKLRKPATEQAATTQLATHEDAPAAEPKPAPPEPKPAAAAEAAEPARPAAVTRAMRGHAVVVVALYARGVPLDTQALAEARSGAAEARAGFAAVNVADEASARWLAATLPGATDPGFVVLRDGEPATQISGYADQALVAQAAAP